MIESFTAYKGGAFALSFVTIAILQALWPFRRDARAVLRNWRVNLPLAGMNTALMGLFCASCVCIWAETLHAQGLGLLNQIQMAPWLAVLACVPILDLTAYFWHRANHRWPLLWRFHAAHHSDEVFEASTALRFHPGELLVSLGVRLVVVTVLGLPAAGIILFEAVFQAFNFFVHGNLNLHERWERALAAAFITPGAHRRHHCVERADMNSNFGTIFTLWDRLFGTYRGHRLDPALRYGLNDARGLTLAAILGRPFRRGI